MKLIINKKTGIALFFICCVFFAKSQAEYAVNNTPDALKENAKAVIRCDETVLTIFDNKYADVAVKYVATILNKNGDDLSVYSIPYDKFTKVGLISGAIYDETGKRVERLHAEDISDFSNIGDGSVYDDSRIKIIDPQYRKYPYTVEYSFKYTLTSTFFLPDWYAFSDYNVSIEKSSFKAIVPEKIELRFVEQNLMKPGTKSSIDGNNVYLWEAENLLALKEEAYCGLPFTFLPTTFLALNKFEIAGTIGDASSWESFGKWSYDLNKGLDVLPDETIQKVKALTANAKTETEKIQILYKYLQSKTRYVSVQIGLGGFQPFAAEKVDRLGYGDCKALSNYMVALLKAADIEAYFTLVNGGIYARPVMKDFPCSQFNHVIVCAPNHGDTVWLECTSQTDPFNYQGMFTDDRYALLIKETGGQLVRTKQYPTIKNCINTTAEIQLKDDGNGEAKIKRTYNGNRYDIGDMQLANDDADKKKAIYKSVDIPHFTLKDFKYSKVEVPQPVITEDLNIDFENYATVMGSTILLRVNLLSKVNNAPKQMRNRLTNINILRGSAQNDTLTYQLPDNIEVSALPEPKHIVSKYGSYNATYGANGKTITYT